MKTSRGLAIGALLTLALVSPSFAVEPGLPSAAKDTTAPVKKPSTFALPHRVTGEVVSVNKRAHAFTLKTLDGVTMLLMTDSDTDPQLSTLRKGDRVNVSYKNSQGDKVATKITRA
jgi:hypothetical protein